MTDANRTSNQQLQRYTLVERYHDGLCPHMEKCDAGWYYHKSEADKLLAKQNAEIERLQAHIRELESSRVETTDPTAVADGVEEVLRVEITSDTPEKIDRFRKELCNLILDAPSAGDHDVMVTIHRGDSVPVFETNRSPVEPSAVCKRCNDLRFVVSTGQIGVPCPECNAEKARARCEWGCHVHWSGWPASHHPNCTVNGEPREPTAFQDFVASLPENGTPEHG